MQATHPIGKTIIWVEKSSMKRNPRQTFTPDLIITGPATNRQGFCETIHPLPGHTPGSMAISFLIGQLFVGDIFMNVMGPQPAYLWEDQTALQKSILAVRAARKDHLLWSWTIDTNRDKLTSKRTLSKTIAIKGANALVNKRFLRYQWGIN